MGEGDYTPRAGGYHSKKQLTRDQKKKILESYKQAMVIRNQAEQEKDVEEDKAELMLDVELANKKHGNTMIDITQQRK